MFNAKAYSAASATSPLASTTIVRRDPAPTEARHQMARYYLRNSVLELTEAAYLLGYEDASSFARAFRSWEGVPPGEFREAHRETSIN